MRGRRRRTHSVSSWLDNDEHSAFVRRCQGDGVPRSAAVRSLVAEYAAGRNTGPAIHQELVASHREIWRVGINLNQLLRLAHTEVLKGRDPDLRAFAAVIARLVQTINRALELLTPYGNLL